MFVSSVTEFFFRIFPFLFNAWFLTDHRLEKSKKKPFGILVSREAGT